MQSVLMKADMGGGGTVRSAVGFVGLFATSAAAAFLGGDLALGLPSAFAFAPAEADLCFPLLATEAEISCARLASRSRSNEVSIAFYT